MTLLLSSLFFSGKLGLEFLLLDLLLQLRFLSLHLHLLFLQFKLLGHLLLLNLEGLLLLLLIHLHVELLLGLFALTLLSEALLTLLLLFLAHGLFFAHLSVELFLQSVSLDELVDALHVRVLIDKVLGLQLGDISLEDITLRISIVALFSEQLLLLLHVVGYGTADSARVLDGMQVERAHASHLHVFVRDELVAIGEQQVRLAGIVEHVADLVNEEVLLFVVLVFLSVGGALHEHLHGSEWLGAGWTLPIGKLQHEVNVGVRDAISLSVGAVPMRDGRRQDDGAVVRIGRISQLLEEGLRQSGLAWHRLVGRTSVVEDEVEG